MSSENLPDDIGGETIRFPGCAKTFSAMGVGTWAWGDGSTWGMGGYDTTLTEASIHDAWTTSIQSGVTMFDTAEVYGGGESERIIGRLLATDPDQHDKVLIATKFFPSPLKLNVMRSLRDAALGSIERLGVESIDLYQLHGPISLRSHGVLAEALARCHQEGLVSAVGVSNYSIKEMTSIHAELAKRGLMLASNQIEFSPLRRVPDTSGLLAACRDLEVIPLAYSPLGQGRLTGKYSASNPPPGKRDFSAFPMEQVDPVVEVLREIGGDDRTPSQVALRWIMAKGAVPIPGAKNATQAAQNAGALGWNLTPSQVSMVDSVCLEGRRTLKGRIWQHG